MANYQLPDKDKIQWNNVPQQNMNIALEISAERLEKTKKLKDEMGNKISELFARQVNFLILYFNNQNQDWSKLINSYQIHENEITEIINELKPREQDLRKSLTLAQEKKDRYTKIYDEAEKRKSEISSNIERLQNSITQMKEKKETYINELKPRLQIFAKLPLPDDVNQTSEIFNLLLGCLYQSKKNIIEYCKENSMEPPPPPPESFTVRLSKIFTCGAKKPKHDFNSEKIYWEEFKVFKILINFENRVFVKNNGSDFLDKISRLRSENIQPFQMMLINELLDERKQILKDLFEIDLKDNVRILMDIVDLVKQGSDALHELDVAKNDKKQAEKFLNQIKKQKKQKDKMQMNSLKSSEQFKRYQNLLDTIQKSFADSKNQFEKYISDNKANDLKKQEASKDEDAKIQNDIVKEKEKIQQDLKQEKQNQLQMQKIKEEQKFLEEQKALLNQRKEIVNQISSNAQNQGVEEDKVQQEQDQQGNQQNEQEQNKNQDEKDRQNEQQQQQQQDDQDSEYDSFNNNESEAMAFMDSQVDPLIKNIQQTMFSQYIKQSENQTQKKQTQSTSMFDLILKLQKQKGK